MSQQSLKILFLSHRFYPYVGGIEVNSEILAEEFSKAGHQVKLVTWTDDSSCRLFPYLVFRKPSVQELFKLHQWADVVFENNPCLRLSWPAALLLKPSVVAIRTWICRTDGRIAFQDRVKWMWLKRAKGVIAVSDSIRKRCWPKAIVIGNPYRDKLFKVNPNIDRNREFVFLGRLVSDKGADIAIRLIFNLNNRDLYPKKVNLTIIGDGPERQALEQLVCDLRLEKQVMFDGELQNQELVDCLNNHRFLLVPSRWEEPFGNVALEGIACGCIPVVSDGGGLPDAVGSAGLVFERENLEQLTIQCIRLLTDKSLRIQLKIAALRHLELHNPLIVSQQYLKVIEVAFANRLSNPNHSQSPKPKRK